VDALLGQLPARGGSLLIRGDTGVGKSALLAAARARADTDGLAVLAAAGVPAEARMPFAALSQLLRPLLPQLGSLPDRQRAALSAALGVAAGDSPDAFLVGLAVLNLAADHAATSPLLLAVDDAHWLDDPSFDVLTFVARRLDMEPIAMLMTARDDVDRRIDAARLEEIKLAPLDSASSAALLDVTAPELPPSSRRLILETAAGNPLALVELPRSLHADSDPIAGGNATLPITERLERAFAGRVSELPPATRTLLLVAALDEGGGLRAALDAATLVHSRAIDLADVAPAEQARLVQTSGDELRFRHPLVPAAIRGNATATDRRAVHSAFAAVYAADPDRSVWHRAAALVGPDAETCADLQTAADRALQRGAPQVAASALGRAARLCPDPTERGRLLLRAAEIEVELGRTDVTERLLAEARSLDLGPLERARLSLLVETTTNAGWSTTRVDALVDIAKQMAYIGEYERALDVLLKAATRCWWGDPGEQERAAVTAAADEIPCADDAPALLAVLAFADPVGRGAGVIEKVARMSPDASDPAAAYLLGSAATAVWAYDLSLDFLTVAVDGLRRQGRLGMLAQAIVAQAWAAAHLAREQLAIAAAEEGARLSRETGQDRWAISAQLALALIAAERGDVPTMETSVGAAETALAKSGMDSMLALARFVRGRHAVAHQHYDDGYRILAQVLDPTDPAYHPFVGAWGLSDLVEAALHTGSAMDAAAFLDRLESLAAATGGGLLRAQAAYARPMLAGDDDVESLYRAALDGALAGWPCYRGRTLLWYGRWLRRQRRVADSRAPLRAAMRTFEALAFPSLMEHAEQELRASGDHGRGRLPRAWNRLTPQELHIAQLAATGLTNREIGEKLYLSHRTVGSHLHRLFPKLGITSRSQLRDALDDLPPENYVI
jgi:DNA-binding CsgD family transcriptional regulator